LRPQGAAGKECRGQQVHVDPAEVSAVEAVDIKEVEHLRKGDPQTPARSLNHFKGVLDQLATHPHQDPFPLLFASLDSS
jgi:hypothetical protein